MSGGVDSSVVAGLLKRAGLRRRRHHAPALRPRRRDPSQGRLLRRPGHPRRPPRRRGARHPALRARLRGPLPRGGDRPLRRELPRGRDADPLRRVQPLGQVPRPPGHSPATSAPTALATGHYVASRALAGRRPRRCYRAARSGPRPELLPLRHHGRAARLPALPPGRAAEGRDPARSRASSASSVAEKPDSQDICFVPQGRYADVIARLRPGRGAARRDRRPRRPRARAARGHRPLHGRPAPRPRLAVGEPLYVVRLEPDAARVVVGPRAALATSRIRLARRELARRRRRSRACASAARRGARALDPASRARRSLTDDAGRRGRDRAGRRPRTGSRPGQACVIYADDGPRARVLGGGTIRRVDALAGRGRREAA